MSSVKEKFEAALAQRKKQKAEEASRGNFSGGSGYPDVPYAPLYTDKQQAFRLVGLPYLVREKPTDSKRVHIAMILGDDDKKFRCIGPDPQEHKDWILYRVMNKVLSRHWDKNIPNSNGQLGAYVYDYATLHPELYNRVAKNNNVENTLEKGWRFTPYVLFNVIDRANYDWHLENKKFRVLSKKASEWQDKVFFEPGVPDTVFQLIMDDIVAGDGNTDWEDYDIVIRKVNEKPWYKVLHGIDHIKYLDEDVKAVIVDKGISDEERSWELNDFDKLFTVTRYARLKSKIGLFIQKVDQVFKTKYYEELLAMAEKEEADLAEQQMKFPPDVDDVPSDTAGGPGNSRAVSPVSTPAASPAQPAVSVPQSPAPSAPPVRSPFAVVKVSTPMTDAIWAGLADGSYNGKHYLGVPLMTDKEKSFVLGVNEDGSFDWSPDAGELMEGSVSHFVSGANVAVDPLDGTRFELS
ncbi:MAG: hypothetical protein LBK66_06975 [Spirochaetaceae bacterium]|jgi:hypothetical protein|nr:hypothetical protein [Spirochaetaceae bacterium]